MYCCCLRTTSVKGCKISQEAHPFCCTYLMLYHEYRFGVFPVIVVVQWSMCVLLPDWKDCRAPRDLGKVCYTTNPYQIVNIVVFCIVVCFDICLCPIKNYMINQLKGFCWRIFHAKACWIPCQMYSFSYDFAPSFVIKSLVLI